MCSPDRVAELAHASVAAGTRQHPAGQRLHLGPRVGRDDGHADHAEALGVVDVVADERRLLERDVPCSSTLTHDGDLVDDTLLAVRLQLPGTRADDGVALHGDDQVPHADLVEPP